MDLYFILENQKVHMIKIKFVLCWCILFVVTVSAKEIPAKKILMILWRGETEAERGFEEYFEQKNLAVDIVKRNCGETLEELREILKEIPQHSPDLIYTFGTTVSVATVSYVDSIMQKGRSQIPIVFNIVSNPQQASLADRGAHGKRLTTGASQSVPIKAQLNGISEMVDSKNIIMLYNAAEKNSKYQLSKLKEYTAKSDFSVLGFPVDNTILESPHMLDLFFKKNRESVIYLPSDSYIISNAAKIVVAANKYSIPVFSATEGPIRDSGALFGLVSRYYTVGQLAASKAEKILFGEVAVELIPIEQLKRFSFVINMTTARKINLPPPLLVVDFAEVVE